MGPALGRGVFFLAQRAPVAPLTPLSTRSDSAASRWMRLPRLRIRDRFVRKPREGPPRPRSRAPSIEASFLSTPGRNPTPHPRSPFRCPSSELEACGGFAATSRSPVSLRSRRLPRLLGGASGIDLGTRARPRRFDGACASSMPDAALRLLQHNERHTSTTPFRMLMSSPARWFDPPRVYNRSA